MNIPQKKWFLAKDREIKDEIVREIQELERKTASLLNRCEREQNPIKEDIEDILR